MLWLLRRPPPDLAPLIEGTWFFAGELPHARERILPAGTMQLLINLHEDELRTWDADGRALVARTGGAALNGPQVRPLGIDTAAQRAIAGVNFRVGGSAPFLRAPAEAAAGIDVDLADLWGTHGAVVRERLLAALAGGPAAVLVALETILRERLRAAPAIDPALVAAVVALERGATVADVADRLGLSERRLGRLFTRQVGLTPKRFARVRRFQRVLRLAGPGVDWARIAADCGYYDQAHLIHEFRELAAMCPTAYRPRAPGEHNHVELP